jgi:hypothetical protein
MSAAPQDEDSETKWMPSYTAEPGGRRFLNGGWHILCGLAIVVLSLLLLHPHLPAPVLLIPLAGVGQMVMGLFLALTSHLDR